MEQGQSENTNSTDNRYNNDKSTIDKEKENEKNEMKYCIIYSKC